MSIRVIARLDIKGPNLVKGIHLEGLRVLGKPWDFAVKYYEGGADELIYIDMVASLYGRNNLTEIVRKTAENIFIPLTVGGGIRTVEDVRELLRAGADKVAINTAAVERPALIRETAGMFGSQCIVGSIQAKRVGDRYIVFTDNARENTGRDVFAWAEELVTLGAGELLVTSVDREGTGKGYDVELVRTLAERHSVPVIAHGGCGCADDIVNVIRNGHADAVSASSLFHYHHLGQAVDAGAFSDEGNIEFIKQQRGNLSFMRGRMTPAGIADVKRALVAAGVTCRQT